MPRGKKKSVAGDLAKDVVVDVRGIIKKSVNESMAPIDQKQEVASPDPVLTGWDAAVAESRKLLDMPLAPGQAYFESPEGFIMVDEAGRGRVFCRQADQGRGMWINSKR